MYDSNTVSTNPKQNNSLFHHSLQNFTVSNNIMLSLFTPSKKKGTEWYSFLSWWAVKKPLTSNFAIRTTCNLTYSSFIKWKIKKKSLTGNHFDNCKDDFDNSLVWLEIILTVATQTLIVEIDFFIFLTVSGHFNYWKNWTGNDSHWN